MGMLSRILAVLTLGALGERARGAVPPEARRRAERASDDGSVWWRGPRSPSTATTFTPPIGAYFRRSAAKRAKRAKRARRGCR